MWSPSRGSRPSTGAAPQVPRTSASASLPPWKSGALSRRPVAPGSTMYQTWMTGTPAPRQAAASPATFSTTFWDLACAGAPESAKAPPSMMTSFWRSWMMRAVRCASSRSDSSVTRSPHVGETVARDGALKAVHRRRRGDEQPAPVGAAPVDVAHGLGDLDRADVLSLGVEDADPARTRHPDVAALVELHPVDEVAGLEARRPDVLRVD